MAIKTTSMKPGFFTFVHAETHFHDAGSPVLAEPFVNARSSGLSKGSILKTWAFLCLSFLFAPSLSAQYQVAPFQQTKTIPPLELQLPDNSLLTREKLKKDMPLILMFFSPGCDHCQHQTEAMIKRMKDLAKYQIVMATYQPIEELQEFNKKYQLQQYPNITTGRDIKYILPPFYRIQNFPYLAFYDKNGNLKGSFEGNLSVDEILKRFK